MRNLPRKIHHHWIIALLHSISQKTQNTNHPQSRWNLHYHLSIMTCMHITSSSIMCQLFPYVLSLYNISKYPYEKVNLDKFKIYCRNQSCHLNELWSNLDTYLWSRHRKVTKIEDNGFCFINSVAKVLEIEHSMQLETKDMIKIIINNLLENAANTNCFTQMTVNRW